MASCTDPTCSEPIYARTLCVRHYQQARYHGTIPASVATETPCSHCGGLMAERTSARARYCSSRCKEAARTARQRQRRVDARPDRACRQCGGTVAPDAPAGTQCCSRACGIAWRNGQASRESTAAKLADRKPCTYCGGVIPETSRRNAIYCSKPCKQRAISARNHDPERARELSRRRLYGMSSADFDALLATQDGRCAICRTDKWAGRHDRPCVDHDHDTGRVRGILCTNCNQGLGRFMDSPDLLRAAIGYLAGATV